VFPSLVELNTSGFKPTDLTPLARMTFFERLWLQNSEFDNISPLTRIINLKSLRIAYNTHFDYNLRPLSALNLEYTELDAKQTYLGIETLKGKVRFK
jgi:hypothetical protein